TRCLSDWSSDVCSSDLIGALHLRGKLLNEMSTGEARRVLIARALVTSPRALVLDEPTAGLDLVARQRFLADVSSIARAGTTIVQIGRASGRERAWSVGV